MALETFKISDLDEIAAPAVTDNVPVVEDPGGTATTKKTSIAGLLGVALAAIRALTAAANKIPYFTSSSAASLLTLVTSVGSPGEDTSLPTEKAVRSAIAAVSGDVVGPATNTDANIPQWNGADSKTLKDGLAVVTTLGAPGADTNVPTEKAVRGAILAAGGGDVGGPATNTDGNIPQWDGADSKTLKDGLPVVTSVGDPGVDTNMPTEKAVRSAIAAAGTHTQGTDTALGALGAKDPPIDADKALYRDSAAADALVTSTWAQIKAFLKTYFDTLYNLYVHPNHSGDVTSSGDGAQTITAEAVTLSKMANMATASLLGRNTAGAGAPEVITDIPTDVTIGAKYIYRADGTDVPIADGGTGQSTAQLAINALTAVGAATNEHVLTKDTATGNAVFKAAAGEAIPAGTKMLFYADTAPAGWTLDNTLDDKVVYVTKGSAAGGQTGGGAHSAGTWTQPPHVHSGPSHTHTGPSHSHTTSGHALTTAELAVHSHPGSTVTIPMINDENRGPGGFLYDGDDGTTSQVTPRAVSVGNAGSGAVHDHGATGAGGTGATGAGGTEDTSAAATANTWRPAAYTMIICSKN